MNRIVRIILMGLISLFVLAPAMARADQATPAEQAAEQCKDPSTVAEFGHGSEDYCVLAMEDEIRSARGETTTPTHLNIFEDGSGAVLIGDAVTETYPAETFDWDCHTMGNRICGTEAPRTEAGPPDTIWSCWTEQATAINGDQPEEVCGWIAAGPPHVFVKQAPPTELPRTE